MKGKKFIFLYFLLSSSFFLFSENIFPFLELPKEDFRSLYTYTKDDTNIEFFADGFWNFGLEHSLIIPFLPEQRFRLEAPIFSQEIELSLWFLLNNNWYFETAFAQGFEKNSIAAGYLGDGFVKHIRLSNRGIQFSEIFNKSKFSKDNNETPGILGVFGNDQFQMESFLRLESNTKHKKQFIGSETMFQNQVEDYAWVKSQFFSLPSTRLTKELNAIYVEDKDGEFFSERFPKTFFRVLEEDEYLIYSQAALVFFTKKIEGKIVFSFTTQDTIENEKNRIFDELGFFEDTTSGKNKSFLKKIQDSFINLENNIAPIKLAQYAFAGKEINDESFFLLLKQKNTNKEIDNLSMLIQDPDFFSPFENASYYYFLNTSASKAYVYTKKNESESILFVAEISNHNHLFQFNKSETENVFVQVLKKSNYETMQFPFANNKPELYLQKIRDTKNSQYSIVLEESNNEKKGLYKISDNALLGTIEVFINGLETKLFSYNKTKAELIINQSISENDRVDIYWEEENKGFENANLKTAIGFNWDFEKLKLNLVLSGTLPIFENTQHESFDYETGSSFESLFAIDYKNENEKRKFLIENNISYTLTNPNTKKYFIIDSMNEESKSYYLSKDIIKHLETIDTNLFLNIKNTLGEIDDHIPLEKESFVSASTNSKIDSAITGYVFDMAWEDLESGDWTIAELNLESQNDTISKAAFFSIALKCDFDNNDDFDIYIQLASSFDKTHSLLYEQYVPTWKLSCKNDNPLEADPFVVIPFDKDITDWQTIRIRLTDQDRSFISNEAIARIIVVSKTKNSNHIEIGPYEISSSSFQLLNAQSKSDDAQCFTIYDKNHHQRISEFNAKQINILQAFFWSKNNDEKNLSFEKNVFEFPLQNYRKIGFFYSFPKKNIDFTDNDPKELKKLKLEFFKMQESRNNKIPVLDIILDFEKLSSDERFLNSIWHQVELDLEKNIICIDDKPIPENAYTIIKKSNQFPNALILCIEKNENSSGSIYFDEIYLFDAYIQEKIDNSLFAEFAWYKSFRFNDFPIFEDFKINVHSQQNYEAIKNWAFEKNYFSSLSSLFTSFNFIGFDLESNASFFYDNLKENPFSFEQAFYSISTSPKIDFFNYFTLKETMFFNPNAKNTIKENAIKISLPKNFPFAFSVESNTKAALKNIEAKQNAFALAHLSIPIQSSKVFFQTKMNVDQLRENNYEPIFSPSYVEAFNLQFSNGKDALERNESLSFKTGILSFPIEPECSLQNIFYYSKIKKQNTAQTIFNFKIPFQIKNIQINLEQTKAYKKQESHFLSFDYSEDINYYFSQLAENPILFTSLSFFDLFPEHINANKIWKQSTKINNENILDNQAFNSTYTIALKRNLYLNHFDLCIPSSLDFSLERNILVLDENQNKDTLSFFTKASFTSFNNFGLFSSKKIFSWFEQDEIFSFIQCKIQQSLNTEKIDYSIRFFEQFNLYISSNHSLWESFDISFGNNKELSFLYSLSWIRDGKNSFLKPLVENLIKTEDDMLLIRKNTISYSLEKKSEDFHNKLNLNHELEIKANKQISFYTKLNGSCVFSNVKMESIGLETEISAKLNF